MGIALSPYYSTSSKLLFSFLRRIGLSQQSCEAFKWRSKCNQVSNAWKQFPKETLTGHTKFRVCLIAHTRTHSILRIYTCERCSIELNWKIQTIDSFFQVKFGRRLTVVHYIASIYRYESSAEGDVLLCSQWVYFVSLLFFPILFVQWTVNNSKSKHFNCVRAMANGLCHAMTKKYNKASQAWILI